MATTQEQITPKLCEAITAMTQGMRRGYDPNNIFEKESIISEKVGHLLWIRSHISRVLISIYLLSKTEKNKRAKRYINYAGNSTEAFG